MPWAKLRDGMRYHAKLMTWQEGFVFYWMIGSVTRQGKDAGLVPFHDNQIARLIDKPATSVKRALRALSAGNYIERHEKGWRLLNWDGDKPMEHDYEAMKGVRSSHPSGPHRPDLPSQGGPHRPDHRASPAHSKKGNSKRGIHSSETPISPRGVTSIYEADASRELTLTSPEAIELPLPKTGIVWRRSIRKLEISDDERRSLILHLGKLQKAENLAAPLTPAEMNRAWGRLVGHFIKTGWRQSRAALKDYVYRWFESDLRDKTLRAHKTRSKTDELDDSYEQGMRELADMDTKAKRKELDRG